MNPPDTRGQPAASAAEAGGPAPAADPAVPPADERQDRPDRSMPCPEEMVEEAPAAQPATLVRREWLITNSLGGYASGTLAGIPTRRYHGLLVAALSAPVGRTLMLGQLSEVLRLPNGLIVRLGGDRLGGVGIEPPGAGHLREFRLEAGLPIWRYEVGDYAVEKRVFLAHLQNTVYVLYRLRTGPEAVRLELHPTVHFRPHDSPVSTPLGTPYVLTVTDGRYELASSWPALPPLRLWLAGAEPTFTVAGRQVSGVRYEVEEKRGYESVGDLWCPGFFGADLALGDAGNPGDAGDAGGEASLCASTESWETLRALRPHEALAAETERRERLLALADPRAREGTPAELTLAADQFVIAPGRSEDAARAHAAGDEARSIIAGYHWFTDWGRDTMIGLEGLTLVTGRRIEAGYVLRTFARHVRDGLIPNVFPEGGREGLYHTADASLWFFHALDRYLAATGDRATLELLLPVLADIVEHHVAGTRFGIQMDPDDALLRQGAPGYALTWMDAKVGDWVVTPRRGKAVEINALWYNALCLLEGWLRAAGSGAAGSGDGGNGDTGDAGSRDRAAPDAAPSANADRADFADRSDRASQVGELARRARESFNRRFWYAAGGHLYDVVDGEYGDDAACRPNQIFALSLPHPVLASERWRPVFDTVRQRLLTPLGLRSLAPGEPDYQPTYDGDLRARDAAYHQGTVWAWLIGPFADAWLRVHPGDLAGAHALLQGFVPHLGEGCLGTIAEIFDAEEPWTPRGCVAQAWSVAEVLRAWIATTPAAEGGEPAAEELAGAAATAGPGFDSPRSKEVT
jgi:predicted glycogen debranching enzyme